MVCGVSGTGKSSLIGSLKYQLDDLGPIVDADRTTAGLSDGDEHRGCRATAARIDQYVAKGINFTQESSLVNGDVHKVAKVAKAAGYYIRLFYVGLDSAEEALKRIQNRVEKGGHGIPEEDVYLQFERQIGALTQVLPYCNEAIFFDNGNGFFEVATYRNGEIVPIGNGNRPPWLEELLHEDIVWAP